MKLLSFILFVQIGCNSIKPDERDLEKSFDFRIGNMDTTRAIVLSRGDTIQTVDVIVSTGDGTRISTRKNGKWIISDTMATIEQLYQCTQRMMDYCNTPYVIIDADNDTLYFYRRDTMRLSYKTGIDFALNIKP